MTTVVIVVFVIFIIVTRFLRGIHVIRIWPVCTERILNLFIDSYIAVWRSFWLLFLITILFMTTLIIVVFIIIIVVGICFVFIREENNLTYMWPSRSFIVKKNKKKKNMNVLLCRQRIWNIHLGSIFLVGMISITEHLSCRHFFGIVLNILVFS